MIRLTNHVQNFTCKMCGKCCKNSWKIALDGERAEEYKKIAENDEYFAQHYKCDVDDNGQTFIHNCDLLLADMRCYLHAKYGAESLSSVCLSYPRFFLRTNLLLEVGMSYSCPEAVKLLGTGLTISNITDDEYQNPLPQHPKKIFLNSKYYRFEQQVLKILANEDFDSRIFLRLQECLESGKVCFPAFEKLTGKFSDVQFDFIKYAIGKNVDIPEMEELSKIENNADSLIADNKSIFKDYFMNFFFMKNFYPYRELEEDTLLMAKFVFCLIRFCIALELYKGKPQNAETVRTAICFAEENFMHINSKAISLLNYLCEWY